MYSEIISNLMKTPIYIDKCL